jgi:hypothetical protein
MRIANVLFGKKTGQTDAAPTQRTISPPTSPERPAGELEVRQILPPPFPCSNPHYSLVYPVLDDPARPNTRLIELGLAAAQFAATVDLTSITERMAVSPRWPEIWPGEHYKLLAGLISVLRPKKVIEIGTSTGLSALTIKRFLPTDGRLITFDIVAWNEFEQTALRSEDFDQRLEQRLADLSDASVFSRHVSLLHDADFIFIDAAKDSQQEDRFISNFQTVDFVTAPIFMFDDIRLWNMLRTWRTINRPKLDLTSFGHWSGTGLVDWTGTIE